MATSTVIRVKRRLEDSAQEALVLLCKRAKTAEDSNDIAPSLFVFQATVKDEDNSEANIKKLLPKEKLSAKNSPNIEKIINKLRSEQKIASSQSRYEIINSTRGIAQATIEDAELNLVDVMKKSEQEDSDVQYAYDLYISEKQDFDVSMLDNIVSVEEYETQLLFGSHRDNGRGTPSSDDVTSDDSNYESNWRNDYPDSEHSSLDNRDIQAAFENIDIGAELSSDEELDLYGGWDAGDVSRGARVRADPEDVTRYGSAYAAYKARVLAEDGLLCATGVDDDDTGGYKDDSDDGFYYGEDEDSRHSAG